MERQHKERNITKQTYVVPVISIMNIIKTSFILASTALSFYKLDAQFASLIAFLPTCIEFFPTSVYLSFINKEQLNQK